MAALALLLLLLPAAAPAAALRAAPALSRYVAADRPEGLAMPALGAALLENEVDEETLLELLRAPGWEGYLEEQLGVGAAAERTALRAAFVPSAGGGGGGGGGGEEDGAPRVTEVERRRWTDDTDVRQLLSREGAVPLILTHTPADAWAARRWTLGSLAQVQYLP